VPTQTLPIVDETYAQRIFAALSEMEVSLDADPISHGPKRMNSKIAVCRNHLDRCQQIFLQTSNDLHVLNRALRVAKVEFDLRMQDMLTNDPETRAGRSVRDREAIATMKLRDERESMATIESSISDLDAVMVVVKAKRDDLKDTLGRIRDQLKLCQEEIGLGSRWGSAPAHGQTVPPRSAASGVDPFVLATMDAIPGDAELSFSDLDRIVQASMTAQAKADEAVVSEQLPDPPAEILVPDAVLVPDVEPNKVPATPVVTEPATSGSDADFDSFLSDLDDGSKKPAATAAAVSDIDLDDLIGSLT
jgi:hypothetical protein